MHERDDSRSVTSATSAAGSARRHVSASTDGGRTGRSEALVPRAPATLTVQGQDVHLAVDGAVLAATDGGGTFTEPYRGRKRDRRPLRW